MYTPMSKLVVSLLAAGALASTAGAMRAPAQSDLRLTPEAAVVGYCAAWSTTDRGARDRLLARVWAANGVYSDPEPTLAVGGAALSAAIAQFQRDYPGNRFQCSAPQMDHRSMRVSWLRLGPDGKPLAQGMDFYDLAPDGRIGRVVGFFGAPPAVAVVSGLSGTTAPIHAAAPVRTDLPQRQELQRADLTMSPKMEVITSISEFKKGETVPRHYHHGIETGYVLQGTMVRFPGRAPTMMQTGSTFMNLRDVPHAGFTVVGDQPLRLLTVHLVDKNKPLYEWVK